MIKSRLRNPISKSITTVLKPANASPVAKDALVVVLPTPPFPEVTTIIFAIHVSLFCLGPLTFVCFLLKNLEKMLDVPIKYTCAFLSIFQQKSHKSERSRYIKGLLFL